MFTSYTQVMDYLHQRGLFHMDLTLERVRHALEHVNLARPPFAVAQVVGTNGKGSTATFLASLGQAHGLSTGLFTSPHFVSPTERIRCNGRPLEDARWPELGNIALAAEPDLTYFEFLLVVAMLAFAEASVDIVILEAGLGGRWDATTAVHADILCLTPIDFDHKDILGSTLTAIAEDKAGAMRPGESVVYAPQVPEVLRVLDAKAKERGAVLHPASSVVSLAPQQKLGLRGPHQPENARTALAAWRLLAADYGWTPNPAIEAAALQRAFIPGRLQWVPSSENMPPFLLDGAHNAHGMRALTAAVEQAAITPSAVIFSCLADKDMDGVFPLLRRMAGDAPILVPTIGGNRRALPSEKLAPRIAAGAVAVATLTDALCSVATGMRRGNGPVLICGSLYLLGEFFALYPQHLDAPQAEENA